MNNFYGVSFKIDGKVYIFKSELDIEVGTNVILETERGIQYGFVVEKKDDVKKGIDINKIKEISRVASSEDNEQYEKNLEDAKKAMKKATNIASELKLDMKFIDVVYTFDRKQLQFNYLSDNRVDFRELAKRLASVYRTRIDLRQIGIRDKAKEVGGIGTCGRKLCCASFLGAVNSVSMNMAKNQNIALNPSKINGACGRLMCCLAYEDSEYVRCSKGMPRVGQKIDTEYGLARVVAVDILQRKYIIDVNNQKMEVELGNCAECKK